MNKKIISIISGIIVLLGGAVTVFLGADDESENISPESSVSDISEYIPETESAEVSEISEITESITESPSEIFQDSENYVEYHFRSARLLNEHFEKHGGEFAEDFGYQTAEEYEHGASDVINNTDALFKYEAKDGDGVYYIEQTNEFVILSTDGYIRTYFRPTKGIDYFNRQ